MSYFFQTYGKEIRQMEILDARTHRPLEGGATFTRKFLVVRTLWNLTWLLFGAWIPPPMFGSAALSPEMLWRQNLADGSRLW